MLFAVKELCELFPEHKGVAMDSIPLRQVMTDSRKEMKQSVFVPIVGENFDAHEFLKQAIENGAVAALWQKDREVPRFVPTDFPLFFVNDTTEAMQKMAGFYLDKVSPQVIGITGSNGKTTTKDLTAAVLSTKFRTHKTDGNFNNHIGLPLTIFAMPEDTEVAVLEMGMSQAGEIEVLSRLARPDYALITNIGESHIEYLGSREGIAKAKLEIKAGLKGDGALIFDGDEPLLAEELKNPNHWGCGMNDHNRTQIKGLELKDLQSSFVIDGVHYELPLAGKHNVKNASYVITLARLMGLSSELIQQGLGQIQVTGMRFERLAGKGGSLIINDAYNASPTSMKAVIEVIKGMKEKKNKILVLGDVYELGSHAKAMHRSVAEVIDEDIAAVYTFGEDAVEISKAVAEKKLNIKSEHFTDKTSLQQVVEKDLDKDTVVLVKASRGVKLETIIDPLVEK
ncbi:UDP-N-acetylmuramoyl-tripeptide--D-alanyl-D-alanine ligase [Thalassobacillus devorans]|uniref:UDP-N-acetylmuramoyl-tripeptide--D-alanyl-D-alanine ligase n=1 Tax=Thalassobacillus devorans TaxID=279813 RepID=A0ABQ1NM90_9BACI|nr:UDP-N-acetylmuramoyl-tripeptide--D-alanyl-D-alanine ligase [Thalassobacillus devorans]NIK27811.1 UDP-N-acetylmuramoyl-tripeptide--D-alanyl-D-alanine ligase [Thalassobacillus devorans]GGC80609.1 UDP-N-acetylmuramoyl-tripeptide--D-alanyl-D-alanine ligase [Thalassobacillus devorans]